MAEDKKEIPKEVLELLEKELEGMTGLFEVYDPKTKVVHLRTTDYWKAYSATHSPSNNLWLTQKNGLKVRKVQTPAAQILYNRFKGDKVE